MSWTTKILLIVAITSYASCVQKLPKGKAPAAFLPAEDAADLYNALNEDPVDTTTIINIIGKRTLAQRLEIKNEYLSANGRDLLEDFREKLPTVDLRDLVVPMMTPQDQYLASELNYAMAGLGTDEDDLVEILTTLTNDEIMAVRRSYHQQYEVSLEDDIAEETSDYFRDLLVSLVRVERDESAVADPDQAVADASAMYNAQTDDRWSIFSDILEHRSWDQLRIIFDEYDKLSPSGIEKAIEEDFSGDVQLGLLGIVESVRNRPKYFARRLYQSMAGLGTADRDLVRIVVTRSEIDIEDIKAEYADNYSNSLADDIIDETSEDYQKLLLILIGEENAKKKSRSLPKFHPVGRIPIFRPRT